MKDCLNNSNFDNNGSMQSRKDDKPLTSIGFMLICEGKIGTGSGKNDYKEFEKYINTYTLFTLATLSNIYPILRQSGHFSL